VTKLRTDSGVSHTPHVDLCQAGLSTVTHKTGAAVRERKSFRIDTSHLDAARQAAGLPEGTPDGVVVRVALAKLAGVEITPDVLDTTGGQGSVTRKAKRAAAGPAVGKLAA
jgi:hypothetical protein